MPRTYKPSSNRRYKRYDDMTIESALRDYRNSKSSLEEISNKYGITKSVLHRHKTRVMKKQGGQPVISLEIEEIIVVNINNYSKKGYSLDSNDLRFFVKVLLDQIGIVVKRFRDNLPGPDFVRSFLKRHGSKITADIYNINKQMETKGVTEEYFEDFEKSLGDGNATDTLYYEDLSDESEGQKGIHASNLAAHLKAKHKKEYLEVEQINKMKKKCNYDDTIMNNDGLDDESNTSLDDVLGYFEMEAGNAVSCIICNLTLPRSRHLLKKHIEDKHNKLIEGTQHDTDDDQNCYTEIVYLEDEENTNEIKKYDTTATIIKTDDSPPTTPVASCDEVESFGKYVTSLLKQLPKDICSQLQIDIITLIMNAKMNKTKSDTPHVVTT